MSPKESKRVSYSSHYLLLESLQNDILEARVSNHMVAKLTMSSSKRANQETLWNCPPKYMIKLQCKRIKKKKGRRVSKLDIWTVLDSSPSLKLTTSIFQQRHSWLRLRICQLSNKDCIQNKWVLKRTLSSLNTTSTLIYRWGCTHQTISSIKHL